MATILDRLRNLINQQPAPVTTSSELTPARKPRQTISVADLFGREHSRHDVIRACREMYRTDPRIEGALRMLARDTVRGGFGLIVSADSRQEEAQDIADALIARVNLERVAEESVCLGGRDGDNFHELGVSRDLVIAEVTRKPTLNMVRLSDEFDRFADPTRAFAWVDQMQAALGQVGKGAIYFPAFLIVHSRWNHDGEGPYGTPEYAGAIEDWKYVRQGEQSMAIRRRTRAGVRYVHRLEGADETALEAYRLDNQEALRDPFLAVADYFLNFPGGIDVLEGDPRLGDIADIEHHIQTMTASSPVPLELLAYGENLNRDVLETKKLQYDETLHQVRAWVSAEVLYPIIEREWLLHGLLPETLEYTVTWATKKGLGALEARTVVDLITTMATAGWETTAIWAVVEPYLPNSVTIEMIENTVSRLRLGVVSSDMAPAESAVLAAVDDLLEGLRGAVVVG